MNYYEEVRLVDNHKLLIKSVFNTKNPELTKEY